MPELLRPAWPVPSRVHAVCTTRRGGVSLPPFDDGNLAAHVGDDRGAVRDNRAELRAALGLAREPAWLAQVHGTAVVHAERVGDPPPEADASVTSVPGVACAVLVADCLPVLFCDRAGSRVAAAHAGWRGLCAGVLEATVDALGVAPASVRAWLGPAIGPQRYEVGEDVRDAFVGRDAAAAGDFRAHGEGKWLADLAALARRRLAALGVGRVDSSDLCTASDAARFFSHRRDGRTGRMAALIWLEDR